MVSSTSAAQASKSANDVADPRLVTCGTSPVLAKESGHFVLLDGDDTLLVV